MINVLKRASVKGLAILLAVATLIGIVLPLSASAGGVTDLLFPDYTLGVQEITEAEGLAAFVEIVEDEADVEIPSDIMSNFKAEYLPEYVAVIITNTATGQIEDMIYMNELGWYVSYASGKHCKLSASKMSGVIGTTAAGIRGIFDIASEGFKFFTDNNLLMVMLSITFAGVALGFVVRAFRTSRK